MQLYLVQHGEAKPKTEDPSRPLTAQGSEVVTRMAAFAARHGISVDEIRHSGKLRAKQTADILAGPLAPGRGVMAVPGLNPDDDVQPVAAALCKETGDLMLVGHLPFLSRLAACLLVGDAEAATVEFRNSGIVCLARQDDRWTVRWSVSPAFAG